ncbi:MAG: MBL fold metallo-hydrolase [Thermoanaerobaculia bacterium]|nr:MBL fold metallo-hydrolase [Thermoanaerobaculia bacterium]
MRGVGISPERQGQHLETYQVMKRLFRTTAVDFTFEEGSIVEGAFEAIHVPGHCSGQVCLRLGDVLLSADHVLAGISPHLSPEQITPWTGVGHYFESLRKIERLEGLRLGLGGHKGPIEDLRGRIAEIRRLHEQRHAEILALCTEPRTIAELSREVFGKVRTHHVLLALLETGAQLEYLDTRGDLVPAEPGENEPVVRWVRP